MQSNTSRESGLGLVELFLGSTVLAIAVLGTVGGLMTSLKVAIDSHDESIANEEALAVVEDFRKSATTDFEAALKSFHLRTVKGSGDRKIHSRIILDETRFDPPIDLNGDGDFDDTDLSPELVDAAYIETAVTWSHDSSITIINLVRRVGSARKKKKATATEFRSRPSR